MTKETLSSANGSVGCLGMLAMFSVSMNNEYLVYSNFPLFLFRDGIYPRILWVEVKEPGTGQQLFTGQTWRAIDRSYRKSITGLLMVGGIRANIKLSTQKQELNLVAVK